VNCANDLRRDDIEGRACPCLDGWRCDQVKKVCLRVESMGGAAGDTSSSQLGGRVLNASGGTATGGLTSQPSGGMLALTGGQASGGSAGSALVPQAGSTVSTGGAIASGGTSATGGITIAGGSIATGGTVSAAGSIATGGTVSAAGSIATGGTVSAAGSIATGGTISAAGSIATGGKTNTSGTAGALSCNPPLPPPTTVPICPPICSNCNGGVCNIDCSLADCLVNVKCPAGLPCAVDCADKRSCTKLVLDCPKDYACNIKCGGGQSCDGMIMNCAESAFCGLSCGSSNKSCTSSTALRCGSGDCQATCAGADVPAVEGCANSCRHTGCGCI